MVEPLRIFEGAPKQAQQELLPFLRWLGRPALFHLRGRDRSRCRVLVGGLHGNEPSGFHALHRLLREPPDLPVDAILILGNVPAALDGPGFYERFLPREEDMNRVWSGSTHTRQRQAAAAVLRYLARHRIEAAVDLHNNTGFNPIYAVILRATPTRLALARHWTRRHVRYEGVSLSTFLEVADDLCPGVVIECGQAGDPEADRRALAGARSFLSAARPWESEEAARDEASVFRCVARVTVPGDVSLTFANDDSESDLTIRPGIDRHNFELLRAGTLLARRRPRGRLVVTDNKGREVTGRFLAHDEDRILLTRDIVPVMMTNNGRAAKSDCLLYVAERVQAAAAR
ncbi:MAG: succinylglutamate desuccinylase/aspartoacylase family protein [Planctomycetota bacterium]